MIEDKAYQEATAENLFRDKANDPRFTVRARQWSIYGPVLLSAILAAAGVGTMWMLNRVTDNFDKLEKSVWALKDDMNTQINSIRLSFTIQQGQISQQAQHTTDLSTILDHRIDSVGDQVRKNSGDITDLQKRVYTMPGQMYGGSTK